MQSSWNKGIRRFAARDAEIFESVVGRGLTLAASAETHGITIERVRQIVYRIARTRGIRRKSLDETRAAHAATSSTAVNDTE